MQPEKAVSEHVQEQPQSIPVTSTEEINWTSSLFNSNTCNTDG